MKISAGLGEDVGYTAARFQPDRELMPFAVVIRTRIKRGIGGKHGGSCKVEVVSSGGAVALHILDHLCGGANAIPMNPVIALNHHAPEHATAGEIRSQEAPFATNLAIL